MPTAISTFTSKVFRYEDQQATMLFVELPATSSWKEGLGTSRPGQMRAHTSALHQSSSQAMPLRFTRSLAAFYKDHRYDHEAFQYPQNFFALRNLTEIVLEVPTDLIGEGQVHCWATTSLYGHAPEIQVSRWGLPLITHIFLNDPTSQDTKEQFNTSVPSEDGDRFSKSSRASQRR